MGSWGAYCVIIGGLVSFSDEVTSPIPRMILLLGPGKFGITCRKEHYIDGIINF